ncbi:hypothetical protein REPUB_Repub03eG0244900 [Reevesia pubescens]
MTLITPEKEIEASPFSPPLAFPSSSSPSPTTTPFLFPHLHIRASSKPIINKAAANSVPLLSAGGGCDGNNNNNNNDGPFGSDSWRWNEDSSSSSSHSYPFLLFLHSLLASALLNYLPPSQEPMGMSRRTTLFGKDLVMRLLLPEGFPDSVTCDYLDYSLWRGVQGVASQISGVLATQALLYAVGLGKGAIPTAAAINWVLEDGIGYLSKITLSKYGRHFDVNPKGWRLFADLLGNATFGLEMLTPAFPHLFVLIGATSGAGRSAAALIQAATRSCFCACFAVQMNFAEVIAKGEAQGMVSKFIGIALGIALANRTGSSTSLVLASFGIVFSEYLLSGQTPSIKEVNDEEPLFPAVPFLNLPSANREQSVVLSSEAKQAAAEIERRLQFPNSDIVKNKEDALALFCLYRDEGYVLTEQEGKSCVVLKESSSPQDMLKSLFHVNFLYWLERNAGIEISGASTDC